MVVSTLQLAMRSFTRYAVLPAERFTTLPYVRLTNFRKFHITSNAMKELKVGRDKVRVKPDKVGLVDGEDSIDISYTSDSLPLFPDASTANKIFDDVPYNQLHIINIKSTKNNTIMSVTDHKGSGLIIHSAGAEGFKNTRKGTNVAAQQTATVLGTRAIQRGIKTVRVRIQGIGPGRMGSLKGLQLAGINIVSITDDTRVSWNPPRPRKQRRI